MMPFDIEVHTLAPNEISLVTLPGFVQEIKDLGLDWTQIDDAMDELAAKHGGRLFWKNLNSNQLHPSYPEIERIIRFEKPEDYVLAKLKWS